MSSLRTVTYGTTTLEEVTFANETIDLLTLANVKEWMNDPPDSKDDEITRLINETVDQFQEMLNCSLASRDVTATYTDYGREVRLPYGPVNSLTTVKKIDQGEKETIDSDNYYITGDTLVFNDVETSGDPFYKKGLEVIYNAGYSSLPVGLKNAIKQAITTNFVDKEDNVTFAVEIPSNFRKKAMKWRRF